MKHTGHPSTGTTYTPGNSQNATDFMSLRTLTSHGEFFLEHLGSGKSVLDCGCGPGTITIAIAERVYPAEVIGIDRAESQVRVANSSAKQRGTANVRFLSSDVYALPFDSDRFDRVFCHALMEHLADPVGAMKELYRVLKPGGLIGVCSPDWSGFLLAPPSEKLEAAVAAYTDLQTQNGGDVHAGQKLGVYLSAAGFEDRNMSSRYENYSDRKSIGEYLALQLQHACDDKSAKVFREWIAIPGGMFAQSWVSCTAKKPSSGLTV